MRLAAIALLSTLSFSAFALNCGDTITTITEMTSDLDCSNYTGYSALTLRDDAILRGNGFKLISPNTSVGIYAEGNLIKVKNLTIEADATAKGVEGYNVQKLVLKNVTANNMNMGVDFYSEDYASCDRLKVVDSDLSSNNYGARVNAPSCDYTPKFINSDFSNSQITALKLSAKIVRILGKHNSVFDGSAHGFDLKGVEKVVIRDIDLSNSQIAGTQIFVYSTEFVKIKNTIVGNAQEGIHIYDANEVKIVNTEAINAGVGIKVANDQAATVLEIKGSETAGNNIGALVTSYGSVPFTAIAVDENNVFDYISVQNQ